MEVGALPPPLEGHGDDEEDGDDGEDGDDEDDGDGGPCRHGHQRALPGGAWHQLLPGGRRGAHDTIVEGKCAVTSCDHG